MATQSSLPRFRAGLVLGAVPCFLAGAVALAVVLLPLWTTGCLCQDGVNHAWTAAHYGDALARHGLFPTFIDADRIETGYPLFYGFLFYPLAALAGFAVGAAAIPLVLSA